LDSESEKENILDYYGSLVVAYETVITSIDEAIELAPEIIESAGDEFMACSDFEALHDGTYGWEYFDGTKSSHQKIDYYYNPETRDACLFLEQYLHACMSNRPHYHEVFVHYPAHFLEKVERVLFIGGGDSMVLHEVLKYDDQLELVVGLELDQHVVRSTYSKIGTQPHFNNDKVEWWFGDAAKTLNILPTEYYGTFDLVVVDILSAVAESLEVTDEVTIMEAAMMLMKPSGIIVKNEDEGYVPGSTNSTKFTDYTVDVMYYDVPVYCLQTFVVGSNAVDFSSAKPHDHKISNFYIKGIDEFQAQFDTWYTKGKNPEDDGDVPTEKVAKSSEKSKTDALTMIIEAEEISVPFSQTSASSIQSIMVESVEKAGLNVEKSFDEDLVDGYNLISVLEEGVLTARCFPDKKYCAIDVQLWKSAHLAETTKKELLSGLKSSENSVFRVITTGVYGVEENDNESKTGPPSKKSVTTQGNKAQDDNGEPANTSGIQTTFNKRKNPEIDFKNATMEDYDSVSALAQWHSQEPIGHQTIVKYELPYEYEREKLLNALEELLYDAIDDVLEEMETYTSEDQIMFEDFEVGDGLLIVMNWSEGSLVLLWDGAKAVDMNIFSLEQSARASQSSVAGYLMQYLKLKGTDVFPRGTGRVINSRREFMGYGEERVHPFWAPPKSETKDN
jgi:spermidine synthase/S-adenosylmethionine/arginine decarboxylase-like enzyme